MAKFNPDGPIPGENYTSDTRNYPWHRPPELTSLDAAVEASIKQLTQRESAYSLLTMLQSGVTVVQATDLFVTSGIGAGKWTPDFALMLAGPVSHMIKLMADGYGIKYDMGIEDNPIPTIEFLKERAKIDPDKAVFVADNVVKNTEKIKQNAEEQTQSGFMGSPGPAAANTDAPPPNMEQGMPVDGIPMPGVEQKMEGNA
jgi:hypothetical protein